jgi:hypothetical protein
MAGTEGGARHQPSCFCGADRGRRRFLAPDGAERYLVDEALLGSVTERLGDQLVEPLKTTIAQNQRSMRRPTRSRRHRAAQLRDSEIPFGLSGS